jgi:hypothetical protein
MSEKRGYPNPNYTEEDVSVEPVEMQEEIMIDETVVISPEKFEQLCSKAAALDILTSSIQRSGEVKDDIVLAVTGALPNHDIEKLKKENSNNWDYYWKEKQKVEALEAKCSQLETARKELIEILKQNKIGPYADQAEEEEENNGQA